MDTPERDARDAIAVGLVFLAYGFAAWYIAGHRWRELLPRPSVPAAFHNAFAAEPATAYLDRIKGSVIAEEHA